MVPASAFARGEYPILIFTMPFMILCLVPIILIEFYVIRSRLDIPAKKLLLSSALANAASTIIGVPLAWLPLWLVQSLFMGDHILPHLRDTFWGKVLAVTLYAPLYSGSIHDDWMPMVSQLFLYIPFFFVSWKMEYFIVQGMIKYPARGEVNSACFRANLITYTSLAILSCLVFGIVLNSK